MARPGNVSRRHKNPLEPINSRGDAEYILSLDGITLSSKREDGFTSFYASLNGESKLVGKYYKGERRDWLYIVIDSVNAFGIASPYNQ